MSWSYAGAARGYFWASWSPSACLVARADAKSQQDSVYKETAALWQKLLINFSSEALLKVNIKNW